jgi:hypothetical protein
VWLNISAYKQGETPDSNAADSRSHEPLSRSPPNFHVSKATRDSTAGTYYINTKPASSDNLQAGQL